jgi:hypothetical protein
MVCAMKKALLALGFLMLCLTSARFATIVMAKTAIINPTWIDWVHLAVTVCIAVFAIGVTLADRLKGQMEELHELERTAQEHLNRLGCRMSDRPEVDLMWVHHRRLNHRLNRIYYTLYDSGFPYTPERRLEWWRILNISWQTGRCRSQLIALLDQCVDLYRRLANGRA